MQISVAFLYLIAMLRPHCEQVTWFPNATYLMSCIRMRNCRTSGKIGKHWKLKRRDTEPAPYFKSIVSYEIDMTSACISRYRVFLILNMYGWCVLLIVQIEVCKAHAYTYTDNGENTNKQHRTHTHRHRHRRIVGTSRTAIKWTWTAPLSVECVARAFTANEARQIATHKHHITAKAYRATGTEQRHIGQQPMCGKGHERRMDGIQRRGKMATRAPAIWIDTSTQWC